MQTYSEEYGLWKRYTSSRPGMTLVGIARVAIPITLVNVDVVAQERKSLDLLDEFVLRMTDAGLDTISQVANMCGLDEGLVSKVTLSHVAEGSLNYLHHTDSFELSPMGSKLVEDLVQIRPVLTEFPITFDRLAWSVADYPRSSLIRKSEAAAAGRTILPATNKTVIGTAEITAGALNAVIRFKWPKELIVLEVRKIRFNSYRYLPGELLVFRGDTHDDVSVGLVVDGEASPKQDLALAKWSAQDLLNIRMESPLTYSRQGLPAGAVTNRPLGEKHPVFSGSLNEESFPPIVEVRNFEHQELLMKALSTAQTRVHVASERLSSAVIDEHFCRLLDSALRRRVSVEVAYGSDPDGPHDHEALQRLLELQERHRNLNLRAVTSPCEGALVFDNWRITGPFPWLGHRSLPEQVFRDYTSILLPEPTGAP